jgi:Flp pilus assembly protein TadD
MTSVAMEQLLQPESITAMKKSPFLAALLTATLAFGSASGPAPSAPDVGNNPPTPEEVPPENSYYNEGTTMLFQKKWAGAQQQLEAALAINETMAEAHNNLAYVLRKQGEANYAKSLEHYNRAIELKPKMAEAYMYRGALYVLSGKPDLAQADYDTLLKLKPKLASHLKKIMDTGKEEEPEQFYGVTKKKR